MSRDTETCPTAVTELAQRRTRSLPTGSLETAQGIAAVALSLPRSEGRINGLNPREEDGRVIRGQCDASERSARRLKCDTDLVGLTGVERYVENQVVARIFARHDVGR